MTTPIQAIFNDKPGRYSITLLVRFWPNRSPNRVMGLIGLRHNFA